MELLEKLELVDVAFDDNNKKCVLTFLDENRGEIREINFNRQIYKDEKWIDDEKQAEKVDLWCEEHFGLPFDRLAEAIGERRDVYCYDRFNSLHEVQIVEKFGDDMVGQIFEVDLCNAFDDGKKIALQFEYEGKLYESKMSYAEYFEPKREWFVNPIKQNKQYEKFLEKFQMPVTEIENMIGKTVMIEVKKAMGKHVYSEVKPFKKPKKKEIAG